MNTTTKPDTRATREAILDLLKRSGEQNAKNLAAKLNLTPMAVRLQLYDLAEEGLVADRSLAAGRGRPQKLWALTEKAAEVFPDAHQGLALGLLGSMKSVFGEEGLEQIIAKHGEAQVKAYRARVKDMQSLGDKVQALSEARAQEGYMAEVLADGDEWLLIENHCPICSAAKTCTRLCANELEVFQKVLGRGVNIKREEHILQGARRCAYRVSGA